METEKHWCEDCEKTCKMKDDNGIHCSHYTPREPKTAGEFKVGDRVRVKTKVTHGDPSRRGEEGRISSNDGTGEGSYPWWAEFSDGDKHCYDAEQLEHA